MRGVGSLGSKHLLDIFRTILTLLLVLLVLHWAGKSKEMRQQQWNRLGYLLVPLACIDPKDVLFTARHFGTSLLLLLSLLFVIVVVVVVVVWLVGLLLLFGWFVDVAVVVATLRS
jgi:hypothetical protein